MESEEIVESLAKHILLDPYHIITDIQKSYGPYLYDVRKEKHLLDTHTSYASLPIGYNHPYIVENKDKFNTVIVNKISNNKFYTQELAQFISKFASILPEELQSHLYFCFSGADGCENAIKAAIDWKVRKNIKAGKGEKGTKILHFNQAFHGRHGYCTSVTNTDAHKVMYYPKFSWPRVSNPFITFTKGQASNTEEAEEKTLREIKSYLRSDGDDIAAIMVEPIQGEGGDNHFTTRFFQALRKICDEHEVLLILDEVQTGMGTTGKWWCFEHFNIVPDILIFGKKTQVCGIAASKRLDEVDNVFQVCSRISSTWFCNSVDALRCSLIIDVYREQELVENAKVVGEYLLQHLLQLEDEYEYVTNVRGRGLFVAFDLPNKQVRDKLIQSCYEHDLLILGTGTRSVRLRPSMIFTKEHVDEAIEKVKLALQSI